jgi:cyclophilin family peptidyl-prolyl cis-trans isomerase
MRRYLLAAGICCACAAPLLVAAADPQLAAPAKTSPASPSAAADQFKQRFSEFKKQLGKLHVLQTKFQLADESKRPEILSDFFQGVAETSKLVPDLQASAIAAFQADPKNAQAGEFLMANLVDAIESDNYPAAAKIARLLHDGDYAERAFANFAGAAEYGTQDFAQAKIDLEKASAEGLIDKNTKEYLPHVQECEKLWELEQPIRAAEAAADDLPRVRLTTSKGDIVLELFENEAPNTTANFISLVEKGFYDGLKFHRVIPGFMAQGGDPNGDGTGGPKYYVADETRTPKARKHFGGSLSMANAGPDTNGSQFFLTFVPTPNLNGKHTVFGRVIDGFDALASLQRIDPEKPNPYLKADTIEKATVVRKREHEYQPETIALPAGEKAADR